MAYVNLGQVVWPVGAIYMSSSDTSPASLFGGSWEQFTDSRMWLPQNNYGNIGGETTHTLTIAEMPKHFHETRGRWGLNTSYATSNYHVPTRNWESNGTVGNNCADVGGNGAHNNMPPYRTCYCWRRKS